MKVKEAFQKVETYNELAELMNEEKKALWFADITSGISFGESFKTFAEFRKYIKHEYFKEVADRILHSDGWTINGEIEIMGIANRELKFELSLTAVY